MPRPPAPTPPRGERIAKLLARAGIASRREVERMIAEGRITLDGAAIATPATVLTSLDGVAVDGQPVAAAEPARLFVHHKPAGLLVTERDPRGRPTIYDRLPAELPRVVPVGRLDLATEGLLLLTTDGELKRALELPANGVERTYRARAYGQVSQAQLEELIDGVEVEGVRYGSIDANLERRTGANVWIELTLTEGKNREVRRVLEHLGLQVGRLIRTRYGPFVLGDLAPGAVGEVAVADVATFRAQLDRRVKPDAAITVAPLRPPQAQPREGDRSQQANGGGATRRSEKPHHHRAAPGGPPPRASSGRSEGTNVQNTDRSPRAKSREGSEHDDSASRLRSTRTERAEQATDNRASRSRGPHPSHPAGAGRAPSLSRWEREGAAKPRKGEAEQRQDKTPDTPPRPPRPQRKPGWARPKPRSGPGRPKRP